MKNSISIIIFHLLFLFSSFLSPVLAQYQNFPFSLSPEDVIIPRRVLELNAENKTKIELNINKNGHVNSARFISGNEFLFNSIEEELFNLWTFGNSSEETRKVELILETNELTKEVTVKPYNATFKVENLKVFNKTPKKWKEGVTECRVHHELLKKDLIKIKYGCFSGGYAENEAEVEPLLFPNANNFYYGGGVRRKNRFVEVVYCQKCRDAKQNWGTANMGKQRFFRVPLPD